VIGCVLSAPVRERGVVCRAGRDASDVDNDLRRYKDSKNLSSCVLAEPIEVKKVKVPAGARVTFWHDGEIKQVDSPAAPLEVEGLKGRCPIVTFEPGTPHKTCRAPATPDAGVEAPPEPPATWYLEASAPAGKVSFAVPVVLDGRTTGPEYRLVQQKERIAGCFTPEAVGESALGGEVVMRVVIDQSGLATLAAVEKSTFLPDATIGDCLKSVLVGAPLENPTPVGSTVDYRFKLQRN
jgi:hypothetical protein